MITLFDIGCKHQAAFEQFHAENPKVYELFKKFTFELIFRRRTHYSADAIIHRVRWETNIIGGKDYKINNNFVAYYVRLFNAEFPECDRFFEIRRQKA